MRNHAKVTVRFRSKGERRLIPIFHSGPSARRRIGVDALLLVFLTPIFCASGLGQNVSQVETPSTGSSVEDSDPSRRKPNVLFLAIDDLRPELGCYGNSEVVSPNLDRFAASGVVFNRAYCQVAVCNPSRVSVMTGLRPDTTQVWDLVTRFRETTPDAVTLPQHFKANGYRALSFGKIFHNPWPDNQSWSEPHRWPANRTLWSEEAKKRRRDYQAKLRAEGKRSEARIERLRSQATEKLEGDAPNHIDALIATQAIDAMKSLGESGEPFFLAAGFVRPHLPFVVPAKYWDLYDSDNISLAENPLLPKDIPSFSMNTMYELRDYIDFDGTPAPLEGSLSSEQQRRLKHGYLASVSFIDHQVGRILEELDRSGLAKNTIVVLWSDHGWKLGEHNSWCKQTNYEIDTRVPLIVKAPGVTPSGGSSDAVVELLDLYPTLCGLAGIDAPEAVEGRDLGVLLEDPKHSWPHPAFSQYHRRDGKSRLMGYAIRTDRYRFVEWKDRKSGKTVGSELYDHRVDPQENVNVAADEMNSDVVARLSKRIWKSHRLPNQLATEGTESARPKISVRNRSGSKAVLFWVGEDGGERQVGVIAAGAEISQKTTLGHRFIARFADGRNQPFVVKQNGQLIQLVGNKQGVSGQRPNTSETRPNVVVCVADDWSWPHAGALGDPVARTPHFDRVVAEGLLIQNAFVSTPSCTPSRLSLLTGQHHWRLREGQSLGGSLRAEYPVYTELLGEAGYSVGRFGKGVWPSRHEFRKRDSFGPRFRSFKEFVKQRDSGQPFCYFHGGQSPHRPYAFGAGERAGFDLSEIVVPGCLPDHDVVRNDLADYLVEVEQFDGEVGEILAELKRIGELESTIVIVTSDNGMPFPRCKGTLYDFGTRVPLAVRWGKKVSAGSVINTLTSLCDLAPTILDACGVHPPDEMTGKSQLSAWESARENGDGPASGFVLTGVEKHVFSYPRRAIRTPDYLYIVNFEPDQWQSGEGEKPVPEIDFAEQSWPKGTAYFSYAIDPSPTKQLLERQRSNSGIQPFAERIFRFPPKEELYDLKSDPQQLTNVADRRGKRQTKLRLRRLLVAELIKTNDARMRVPGYQSSSLEGWPIRISEQLLSELPDQTAKAIKLLAAQLKLVKTIVPSSAVDEIVTVPIWLSPQYEGFGPSGEYHPSAGWLNSQGRRPELHQCIEFSNIPIFEKEIKRMPVLVLHELAHAYHDQVLGFDDSRVKARFDAAKASGGYDQVQRGTQKVKEKAYAMTNEREYFAETSEAFFGRNDFFPFDRRELDDHDPGMSALLKQLWRVDKSEETSK